jgi:hypothetical protein
MQKSKSKHTTLNTQLNRGINIFSSNRRGK